MDHLHYELDLGSDDVVYVTLDQQANVKLLDGINYQSYKSNQRHTYFGGLAKISPAKISAPHTGHWHLAIDLGGYSGTVHASVQVR